MTHRAASRRDRMPVAPARSLLALALALATVPAWAQSSPEPVPADTAPVAPPPLGDAATPAADATSADAAPAPAVAPEATPPTDEPPAPAPSPTSPAVPEDPATSDATVSAAVTAPQDDSVPAVPPEDAPPAEPPTGDAPPTAAESDFDALYGTPAADGEAAQAPAAAYDPWQPYNRRMHRFNNAVDRRVARPLARAYVKVVPRPVRSGVSNFFSNLGQPITAVNALLQGRPREAGHALGRFVLNSTLGIAGVFDPATDAGLDNRNEDFGQTLGVWGWKRSRYVELPFFGPRTLRDVVGMAGDAPLSPLRQVEVDKIRVPLQGMQLVDMRAQLLSTDSLREGAQDDYTLVRDAWMQRRTYQIDEGRAGDDNLPDYLKDEAPMVPVNAMPVMPPSGD